MSKYFTLEEATEQINDWRKSKKGIRGRIPEYSWRHAVRLSKEHTAKVVAKKMGFKLSDLESKIENFNRPLNHTKVSKDMKATKKVANTESPFIEVPESLLSGGKIHTTQYQQDICDSTQKCILELDLNNGMKVRIFG